MTQLVVVSSGKVRRVAPLEGRFTIGRDPGNDLRIDQDGVSRWHCVIAPDPETQSTAVIDQGSTNGTLINGIAVGRSQLQHGDRIGVGDTTILCLPDDADPEAAAEGVLAVPTPPNFERPPGLDFQSWLLHLIMVCQAAGSQAEAYRVVARLLEEILGFTGFSRGLFLLNGGDPHTAVAVDRAGNRIQLLDFDPAVVTQAKHDLHAVSTRTEEQASLCLPLIGPEAPGPGSHGEQHLRTIGHLYFDSTTPARVFELTTNDERFLESVASQLALVLLNVVLLREAATDPLTGLSNRRSTERIFRVELARARELNEPLSVLMLDLDHFKRVNDTYGHQVGDEVLQGVANRARQATRRHDCLGRWGGEEFLVVLPGTDLEGALRVAEKIARGVDEEPLGTPGVRITVSIGAAVYPLHGQTLETLVRNADQALYSAKAAGRNRTVVYEPQPSQDPLPLPDSSRTQRLPLPAFRRAIASCELSPLTPATGVAVGRPGPSWRARSLREGTLVGPEDLKGRVTLLHFWTPWCSGRCERGHDFLERLIGLRDAHPGPGGPRLVGVVLGEDSEFPLAFCDRYGLDWEMLIPLDEPALLEAFRVEGLPAICLLDADGCVMAAGPGWRTLDEVGLVLAEVAKASPA